MLLDILIALLAFPNLKRRRVLRRGERVTAHIDAIRITKSEDGPAYRWGVRLPGGRRAGVEQQLRDEPQLGDAVRVWSYEGLIVIDQPEIDRAARPLKRPPAPGIYDQYLPREERWMPVAPTTS